MGNCGDRGGIVGVEGKEEDGAGGVTQDNRAGEEDLKPLEAIFSFFVCLPQLILKSYFAERQL